MKHFEVMRKCSKKLENETFRQVTHFPWSCHIFDVIWMSILKFVQIFSRWIRIKKSGKLCIVAYVTFSYWCYYGDLLCLILLRYYDDHHPHLAQSNCQIPAISLLFIHRLGELLHIGKYIIESLDHFIIIINLLFPQKIVITQRDDKL